MTLQQLIYINEIEKHSSFSEAARNLFVSQSVLSISVTKLEKEMGFKIFERTNKGIIVTNMVM